MNKIKEILNKINNKGYSSYIVGGYVRDKLLGINSNDIDIATNMPFNILKETFNYEIEYPEYFCIKFKIEFYNISITTFRNELEYRNNKPVSIEYTTDLKDDAKRRDFTINSIYMDIDENIIDLYKGINDINNKAINVIGNINIRLTEDKTRILRALRFMSVLDFELSNELKEFIINNKSLIKEISYEKKKEELDKIFKTKGYKKFLIFIKDNNLEDYFEIYFDEIKECNHYLDVWNSLNISDKYVFSKKEKNYLLNLK